MKLNPEPMAKSPAIETEDRRQRKRRAYRKAGVGLVWQGVLAGLIAATDWVIVTYADSGRFLLVLGAVRILLLAGVFVVVWVFMGPLMLHWTRKGAERDTARVIARMRARGDFDRKHD